MTTIGVSIPIPPPWGERLQRCRRSFGDPLADAIPTHVTLLPPTRIAAGTLPAVRQHLAEVAAVMETFPMLLRGTGTFRPISPVVFVQVARGVAHCELLEGRIRSGPLQRELHFPYHPHVTVAHDVDPAQMDRAFEELADFSCAFQVTAFDLYVHGADNVWRSVDTFAFGSAGSSAGESVRDPRPTDTEWHL